MKVAMRIRAALIGCAVAACGGGADESSATSSGRDTPSNASGGNTEPDSVAPPEPGQCSNFVCVPPACCGQTCRSDADCCRGTGCSAGGVCIPESCQGCGGLTPFCTYTLDTCEGECAPPPGCGEACNEATPCGAGTRCTAFDSGESRCVPESFEALCQAQCADEDGRYKCTFNFAQCDFTCAGAASTPPPCCLDACEGDGDCCAGTFCGSSGRCVPDGCGACNGYLPFCTTEPETCTPTCVPPPTCGEVCSNDADCGARAVCKEFFDGERKCVPDQFDAACGACGETCTFRGSDCSVSCEADEPSPPPDGPVRPPEGEDLVEPPMTSCGLCCDACRADTDCCAGFLCSEETDRCIPAECSDCASGRCAFDCPLDATAR